MKYLDLLSPEIKLYFNKKTNLQTFLGTTLTILIFGLVTYSTWLFGKDIIFKKEPTILIQNNINIKRPFKQLTKESFPIAITIQDFTNAVINEPTILIFQVYDILIDNSNSDVVINEILTEPCENKHFPNVNNTLFDSSGLGKYTCIKDQDLEIGGFFSEQVMRFTKIDFKVCLNTTENNNHCKSKEEIKEFIETKGVAPQLYILDSYIDLKDYKNPVKYFINNIYKLLSNSFSKTFELHLKNNLLITDDGPLFSQINKINALSIGRKELDLYISNTELFSFFIFGVEEEVISFRTYIKIQNIAANLGGIIKILLIIGYVINYYFAMTYRNIHVANSIIRGLNNGNITSQLKSSNLLADFKEEKYYHNLILPYKKIPHELRKSCKNLTKLDIVNNPIYEMDSIQPISIMSPQNNNIQFLTPTNLNKDIVESHFKIHTNNIEYGHNLKNKNKNQNDNFEEIDLSFLEMLKILITFKYCCWELNKKTKTNKQHLEKFEEEIMSKLDVLTLVDTSVDVQIIKKVLTNKNSD